MGGADVGIRPDDRLRRRSGPYRIEVVEPFHTLRLVCDADAHGIGFDLTYRSEFGPISEPQHVRRMGDRILLDASRFAGVGTWSGELRVDGETIAVTPERFTATRDRSWGIRPVGEAEPPGRPREFDGMWWNWIPLRFDDFALHVILEEDPSGSRNTNYAMRVWPAASGRAPEQLGWPIPEIDYKSGTRWPTRASMELTGRDGKSHTLDITPLVGIPLNIGCGYGADPDWTHGLWKGDDWIEGSVYDHNDPAVSGRGRVLDRRSHRARDVRRSDRLGHLRARQHREARAVGIQRHDAGRALTARPAPRPVSDRSSRG